MNYVERKFLKLYLDLKVYEELDSLESRLAEYWNLNERDFDEILPYLWQSLHEVICRLSVCQLRWHQALHMNLLHFYCQTAFPA
jgi:hypothetical protein